MAFVSSQRVMRSQELIDSVLTFARKQEVGSRSSDSELVRKRKRERERITAISTELVSRLRSLSRQFPDIDALNEFYRELVSCEFDIHTYKRILSRVQNSAQIIHSLVRIHRGRLEAAQKEEDVASCMSSFIGRVCSAVNDLDSSFIELESIRRKLLSLPIIKELPTVCIAGFPNVGKTTLFARLTGSQAEINAYAFTTKRLNVGYIRYEHHRVQVIDTPGTLHRDHMNAIERQADTALKYVADLIVYVFDPTEQYSREQQMRLLEHVSSFSAPVVCIVSKKDLVSPEQVQEFVSGIQIISEDELQSRMRSLVL